MLNRSHYSENRQLLFPADSFNVFAPDLEALLPGEPSPTAQTQINFYGVKSLAALLVLFAFRLHFEHQSSLMRVRDRCSVPPKSGPSTTTHWAQVFRCHSYLRMFNGFGFEAKVRGQKQPTLCLAVSVSICVWGGNLLVPNATQTYIGFKFRRSHLNTQLIINVQTSICPPSLTPWLTTPYVTRAGGIIVGRQLIMGSWGLRRRHRNGMKWKGCLLGGSINKFRTYWALHINLFQAYPWKLQLQSSSCRSGAKKRNSAKTGRAKKGRQQKSGTRWVDGDNSGL